MANRKVLVQDDGTGHQAYVDELVTTGASEARPIYVGDADPADDHLADLLPGDVWIDTAGGVPYQQKFRNATNIGWDWAGFVARDAAGVILFSAGYDTQGIEVSLGEGGVDASLSITASVIALLVGTTSVTVDSTGAAHLGSLLASVDINADGSLIIVGAGGAIELSATGVVTLPAAPTGDPAAPGVLWVDPAAAFVVKQSQG